MRDLAHPAGHRARGAGQGGLRPRDIAAIGITNQRETTVLWNRRTGQPVHHAIVWQDRRTAAVRRSCARRAWKPSSAKTGLVIDPTSRAPSCAGCSTTCPARARCAAERGELAFGTVDSWLLWKLTGGHVHATDVSNASRTMLFDIRHTNLGRRAAGLLHIPDSAAARRCTRQQPCVRRDRAATCSARRSRSRASRATSRPRCSARPASRPAWPRTPTAPAASC
jgi:glycerol kinase